MTVPVLAAADVGGVGGWVVDVIDRIGPVGVGLLIALETVVPPLPSELVLAFSGFSVAQGTLNGPLAWLAATVGSLAGAYLLYGVGALVGVERLHQLAARPWFVLLSRRDLDLGERFFDRHGAKVVLLGRCLPLARSAVSIPAGLARMPLWRFTWLTAVGSSIWNAALLYAGFRLGEQWASVEQYVAPAGAAVGALAAAGVLVLVVRKRRQAVSSSSAGRGSPSGTRRSRSTRG
ncbi:MAG: rane protein [Frankiales bacterium]|nr:rane protein [Frankiales bacterium]